MVAPRVLLHGVRDAWRNSPVLRRTVGLVLVCELLASVVLPAVMPERLYFPLYQNDPRAQQSVAAFFRGEAYLEPDPVTGWRNRPNVQHGAWVTDQYGSRSHELLPVERRGPRMRVLFLGSSKVNGGTVYDRSETISAKASTSDIETLNFGTMAFAVDQCYLAYRSSYSRFQPDVVVLGLDPRAEDGLVNVYLPLRGRAEVLMPYVKPRYELAPGGLNLVPPPLPLLRSAYDQPQTLLTFAREHDGFYPAYEDFRRFSFTPLAAVGSKVARKLQDRVQSALVNVTSPPTDRERLLLQLLAQFRDELAQQDRRLLVLMLPNQDAVEASSRWNGALRRHERMRALLAEHHVPFVDTRDALRAQPMSRVYSPDAIHYTVEGNGVIAAALAPHLSRMLHDTTPTTRAALAGKP